MKKIHDWFMTTFPKVKWWIMLGVLIILLTITYSSEGCKQCHLDTGWKKSDPITFQSSF